MKHPKTIVRYNGTLYELAVDVGSMSYDSVAELLDYLAGELRRQARADSGRGRKLLAGELEKGAQNVEGARNAIREAWEICKPHMLGD